MLHGLIVHSMKAKQTTRLEHVQALRKLIDDFEQVYTGRHAPAPHKH